MIIIIIKELSLSLGVFAGIGFGYDLQSYKPSVDKLFTRNGFYGYASLGFNIIFNSQ